jgi:hypothetical protein
MDASCFKVLFQDDLGFWCELAGGNFRSQFDAEKAAKCYFEKSCIPCRVTNGHTILWDSAKITTTT